MRCNATEKGMDKDEECFEGFAYDLVEEMAKYNGFKFKFTTNQDYGIMNHKTGKWSGMIGELQSMVSFLIKKKKILITEYFHKRLFPYNLNTLDL